MLLGTSTNLVVQALLDTDQYKHQTLGMFELAPVGGVLTGVVADGVVADCVVVDGVFADCVVVDGVVVDGEVVHGVVADGVVVDGVLAEGVLANGGVLTVIGSLYMSVVSPHMLGGDAESAAQGDEEVVAAYGMVFTVEEVCLVVRRMCAGCRSALYVCWVLYAGGVEGLKGVVCVVGVVLSAVASYENDQADVCCGHHNKSTVAAHCT